MQGLFPPGARGNLNLPGAGGVGGMSGLLSALGGGGNDPELAAQADSMWKMLDSMQETDPEQYKKFIGEQIKAGAKQDAEDRKAREFVPSPGFVVEAELLQPEILGKPKRWSMLYVNVCFDERAPQPTLPDGTPVTREADLTDAVVPVSVGVRRDDRESKGRIIVDVVVAPVVVNRARAEPRYKRYVGDLVLKHVLPGEAALNQRSTGRPGLFHENVALPALGYKAGKVPKPHVISLGRPPVPAAEARPKEASAPGSKPEILLPGRGGDDAPLLREASSRRKDSAPLISEVGAEPEARPSGPPLITEVGAEEKPAYAWANSAKPLISEAAEEEEEKPASPKPAYAWANSARPLITEAAEEALPSRASASSPLIAEVADGPAPAAKKKAASSPTAGTAASFKPSPRTEAEAPAERPVLADPLKVSEGPLAATDASPEWVETARCDDGADGVTVEVVFRPAVKGADLDVNIAETAVRVELLPTAETRYLGFACLPVNVTLPCAIDVAGAVAAVKKTTGGKRVLRVTAVRAA